MLGAEEKGKTKAVEEYKIPKDKSKMKLVWADEFNDSKVNMDIWENDIGNGFWIHAFKVWVPGWGNDEIQYYREMEHNVVEKDGNLSVVIKQEDFKDPNSTRIYPYTSARVKSKDSQAFKYGRIEIKARMPEGQGLWPAIWLLPAGHETIAWGKYGGWAASGEIDIMESRGRVVDSVSTAMHYGGQWPKNTMTHKWSKIPKGKKINDFHVYALEWETHEIRWYIDDILLMRTTSDVWFSANEDGSKRAKPAPFDQKFKLIMNVAVGGKFDASLPPNSTVKFPAKMDIDYVRVYK